MPKTKKIRRNKRGGLGFFGMHLPGTSYNQSELDYQNRKNNGQTMYNRMQNLGSSVKNLGSSINQRFGWNSNTKYNQCVKGCKRFFIDNSDTQGSSVIQRNNWINGSSTNDSNMDTDGPLTDDSIVGLSGPSVNNDMPNSGMPVMNNDMPDNLSYSDEQNGGYRSNTPLNNLASSAAPFNGKTAQPQVWVGGKRRTRKSRRRTRRHRKSRR